jgi:hypothetical protein
MTAQAPEQHPTSSLQEQASPVQQAFPPERAWQLAFRGQVPEAWPASHLSAPEWFPLQAV